ncbi:MAG: bifunctional phosphoribosylaminoimidazolecarboxamide formyltransferase/IMP cyclohydrolase [Candidatus Omnitrophica bacterium]|nr:bifunctional phosphoribosylaminoimidazolecarboxamide formyltransferase/IMP cyclohydrolase [Candidatus Omnitrophota bacterium]
MVKIKRALISVSDKTGLDKFVKKLNDYGVEIISTGGTAKYIQDLGISVKLVSDITDSPEMLDGRVKTLHPKIHGGLLAVRENSRHMKEVEKFNIKLIDMVCVNLYPFENVVSNPEVETDTAIENIDIGGPSMLRSAAKNSKNVAVICNPARYQEIVDEMSANNGSISRQTCFCLAVEVFMRTQEYDNAIAAFLKTKLKKGQPDNEFPETLSLSFKKVQTLRYGENPHQKAAFYKEPGAKTLSIANATQLQGKDLSFNNILDLDAAINIIKDFKDPAASIIKHNNPCGVALGNTLAEAYSDALAADPMSAFGSIVGLNRCVDQDTAAKIIDADFVECVVAPGFSSEAVEMFKKKKNLRVMDIGNLYGFPGIADKELDYKRVRGGLLVEDKDTMVISEKDLKVVTAKKPSKEQMASLMFAWTVVKHVKSNAVVIAQGRKTVGIGAGQMSRIDSVIIAIRKAQGMLKNSVLASDAFFPKADSIEQSHQAGIEAIIQPGGSIRDDEVIKAAEKAGIIMVLTGIRHFKH